MLYTPGCSFTEVNEIQITLNEFYPKFPVVKKGRTRCCRITSDFADLWDRDRDPPDNNLKQLFFCLRALNIH